jgi:hypothetical protein
VDRPLIYFKHEDEGDGTYEGQIGHAYLHRPDDLPDDEGEDLGFITYAAADELAREHGADLDVDGLTREEWEAVSEGDSSRSFLSRLFGR